MEENKDIQHLDNFLIKIKELKSSIKKANKIRDSRILYMENADFKKASSLNAKLDFLYMHIDKTKTSIARLFEGSIIDVGTEEKEYNPSPFHSYHYEK